MTTNNAGHDLFTSSEPDVVRGEIRRLAKQAIDCPAELVLSIRATEALAELYAGEFRDEPATMILISLYPSGTLFLPYLDILDRLFVAMRQRLDPLASYGYLIQTVEKWVKADAVAYGYAIRDFLLRLLSHTGLRLQSLVLLARLFDDKEYTWEAVASQYISECQSSSLGMPLSAQLLSSVMRDDLLLSEEINLVNTHLLDRDFPPIRTDDEMRQGAQELLHRLANKSSVE